MIQLMLVEDEEIIRRGIRELIRRADQEFMIVKEAVNGKEALDYLSRNTVDAVITDIRMPQMDGLHMVQKIRLQHDKMPIVIVSGHSDFVYAQKALQCGVTDYLLKPLENRALVAALSKVRQALHHIRPELVDHEAKEELEYSAPSMGEGRRLLRKLKAYIKQHPEEDLRLPTLAERVHLNASYLSQLFKQEEGRNLSDFITEVRIQRACQLLQTTELKVYDIARLSGYQSPKHFMLVFKQQTGSTPSMYRERTEPER